MRQSQNKTTYDSAKLDFLRTVAVLLVVGAHLFSYFGDPVYLGKIQPSLLGVMGVVLFFVHTSWVLMLSIQRQKTTYGHQGWIRSFYIRRIFRIYPLSVFAVTITYLFKIPVATIGSHQMLAHSDFSFTNWLANLTLMQNFFKNSDLIGPLWSLPLEMQMYLVLPFCYWIASRSSNSQVLYTLWGFFAMIALTLTPKILRLNEDLPYWQIPQWLFYLPCFWAGIIAFKTQMESPPRWSFIVLPAALFFLSLLFVFSYDKNKYILAAFSLGSLLPFVKEPQGQTFNKVCQSIAKYSYGIYIFHYFSLWIAFDLLKEWPSMIQGLSFLVTLAALSIASYHLLELPFIKIGNRWAQDISYSNKAISKSAA